MLLMSFSYVFISALLFKSTIAQRPSNASLCDFYAEELYGANSSETQFKLVSSIITLAYAGGSSLSNATNITGILNPGTFNGLAVDLHPWFDGSIASTNLNGQAVEINWIDEGIEPLEQFLTGATPTVELNNTSNQFRLFTHFFEAFGHFFGCTLPQPPAPSPSGASTAAPLNLAYVHKFMNLNFTDIGHFIDQLSLSTQHYGFSSEDTQTLNTQLNSLFNVRCAPPVNGELNSLCQASNCPLAEPSPDCGAYANIGPGGAASTATSTAALASASSNSSHSPMTPIPTITAPVSTMPTHSSSSSALSAGAIAGIAIGAAAVFFLGIGVVVYLIRRPKQGPGIAAYNTSTPALTSRSATSYGYNESHQPRREPPAIAEMESPRTSPEMRKTTKFNRTSPDPATDTGSRSFIWGP